MPGNKTPDKTQRLLSHASWDTFAAMSVVRRFAVAALEEAARRRGRRRGGLVIVAIDETGQEKAGEATAGVKRQYLGCAGTSRRDARRTCCACRRTFMIALAASTKLTCAEAVKSLLTHKRRWKVRSLQRRPVVRLGVARHRLPASSPADPPPPQDR
jgi:hypothetical protein